MCIPIHSRLHTQSQNGQLKLRKVRVCGLPLRSSVRRPVRISRHFSWESTPPGLPRGNCSAQYERKHLILGWKSKNEAMLGQSHSTAAQTTAACSLSRSRRTDGGIILLLLAFSFSAQGEPRTQLTCQHSEEEREIEAVARFANLQRTLRP